MKLWSKSDRKKKNQPQNKSIKSSAATWAERNRCLLQEGWVLGKANEEFWVQEDFGMVNWSEEAWVG